MNTHIVTQRFTVLIGGFRHGPSSELDASFWFFIITLAVLYILMVLTLVPFTAALVAHPRQRKATPVSLDQLRAALLAPCNNRGPRNESP